LSLAKVFWNAGKLNEVFSEVFVRNGFGKAQIIGFLYNNPAIISTN